MVDAVFRWVRGISVVVLTVTFIEMVLPRSDLRKYVDVVVGLAVIAAILTPLLGLGMGIGAGLELAATAARGWSASQIEPERSGSGGALTYSGAVGNYREAASSIASRALEARVREVIGTSYGNEAESWVVKVRVSDMGRLESVDVEMDVPASSADSRGLPRTAAAPDAGAVARTVALALEAPLEVVRVR